MGYYAAIIDIDGVIFDISRRRNLSNKGNGKIDYKVFLAEENLALDEFIEGAERRIAFFKRRGFAVVLLTGLTERLRTAREAQLADECVIYDELLMRRDGDYRKSPEVKAEGVTRYMAAHPETRCVVFVDDQQENREAINALELGCEVVICSNLKSAVQYFA